MISSLIVEVLETHYRENKKFTCGEISSKVLTEYLKKVQESSLEGCIPEKERKTIKRRVYDSINVLIALGKIKKERKWFYAQSIDHTLSHKIIDTKR